MHAGPMPELPEVAAQRILVVQMMARAAGVPEAEAHARLTRIESDPKLLDAHRQASASIGDAIVTDVVYGENGIEVTVAPMARALAGGGRNLRRLDQMVGTARAEQALRRQIALHEVRTLFGRAPVSALPMLVAAGVG